DFTSDQVGIDIVRLSVLSGANRRDHRDEVRFGQSIDHTGIHPHHFADQSNIVRCGRLSILGNCDQHLPGHNHFSIFAAEPNRLPPLTIDECDPFLIDFSQDHLHHFHGGGVGDAHASYEMRSDAELLEHLTDLGPAAVDHNRVHADELEEHDVL